MKLVTLLFLKLIVLGFFPVAVSALSVEVEYDGSVIQTCNDGDACDGASATSGLVSSIVTPLNEFTISLNIGTNQTGSSGGSLLSLSSTTISNGASINPLIIRVSDTGFDNPASLFDFSSALTNTAGASVKYKLYRDSTNELFGTEESLDIQLLSDANNSSNANSIVGPLAAFNDPYSLTLVIEITAGGAGNILATTDVQTVIPIPAAVWLMGSALLGLCVIRRK